ncbi:MAG: PhzF family phenazine biosynthesis isomerase [Alphaproteobacteria bacterium]|nr:PhzF family phenazine biosynthesis isomerase [Alphaproteobacteria bacterium]
MPHAFVTLDVFTKQIFGGNPLAVVFDAAGLDSAAMQKIAREFNLSETTFVLPSEHPDNTHRVRIFTPVAELPFAGHPTLGTAVALALAASPPQDRVEYRFEESIGVIPVSVAKTSDGVMRAELSVAQRPLRLPDTLSPAIWADVLSLEESALCPGDAQIGLWTCGTPFSFVPVANLEALGSASVDMTAWRQHLNNEESTEAFVFTRETNDRTIDIRARMFAPDLGIAEDPATGSAVAALAGWLVDSDKPDDGTHRWIIAQGVEMGRSSLLDLEADVKNGRILGVRVGGCAVPVTTGMITDP